MSSPSRSRSKYVAAHLKLINPAGEWLMDQLGENHAQLPARNRRNLHVELVDAQELLPVDEPVDTHEVELVSYTPDRTGDPHYEGSWDLAYDAENISHESPFLCWTIGSGFLDDEHQGIDVLLSSPGTLTKGVLSVHARIYVHRRSGFIIIEGASDSHPIKFMRDNEALWLGAGRSHSAYQPTNHFFIGEYQFSLTYPRLDNDELDVFRHIRDDAFDKGGLTPPDSRLPLFPRNVYYQKDKYISFDILGAGGCAFVELGMNIETGEPCALKEIACRHKDGYLENMNEVEISTKYAHVPQMLSGLHLFCNHGKSWRTGQHGNARDVFSSCSAPHKITLVQSLAKYDYESLDINKYSIQELLRVLGGPIIALKFLHDEGIMHRDFTRKNLLLMPDGRGVLNDFGKAVHGLGGHTSKTAPAAYRPTEMDGTLKYDDKCDVYLAGITLVLIIRKDLLKSKQWKHNRTQNIKWLHEATTKITEWGQQSYLHAKLAVIIADMLQYKAKDRPSMVKVVKDWPVDYSESLDDSGAQVPPAKIMRKSKSTDVHTSNLPGPSRRLRQAPVFSRHDSPSDDDEPVGGTRQHLRKRKAVDRQAEPAPDVPQQHIRKVVQRDPTHQDLAENTMSIRRYDLRSAAQGMAPQQDAQSHAANGPRYPRRSNIRYARYPRRSNIRYARDQQAGDGTAVEASVLTQPPVVRQLLVQNSAHVQVGESEATTEVASADRATPSAYSPPAHGSLSSDLYGDSRAGGEAKDDGPANEMAAPPANDHVFTDLFGLSRSASEADQDGPGGDMADPAEHDEDGATPRGHS